MKDVLPVNSKKDHSEKVLNNPNAWQIPTKRWGFVATEFITHIPVRKSCFNAITSRPDRLSCRVHFIPSKSTDTAEDAALGFFKRILPRNGIPAAIVPDQDQKCS